MRNLTRKFILQTEIAINNAVSIALMTRISRLACGYSIAHREVEFSENDLAWFRGPVKGGR